MDRSGDHGNLSDNRLHPPQRADVACSRSGKERYGRQAERWLQHRSPFERFGGSPYPDIGARTDRASARCRVRILGGIGSYRDRRCAAGRSRRPRRANCRRLRAGIRDARLPRELERIDRRRKSTNSAVTVVAVAVLLFAPFASLLSLEAERGDGPSFETFDADFLAGLEAIAV